jgi:diacylglycerol kinase (ATP)
LKTSQSNHITGILSVGGDGLAHLILQIAVPAHIPFAIIPAGTGNDIVRTLGWSLDHLEPYLKRVVSESPQPIDLGNVDSEWFAAILSTGFDSVVNERANRLSWPSALSVSTSPWRSNFLNLEQSTIALNLIMRLSKREAMLIAIGNGRSYGGGMSSVLRTYR